VSWHAEVIAPSVRWRRDWAIPDQTLCNWLKAEDKAKARGQDPEALSESELAELKRLRKDNAELDLVGVVCPIKFRSTSPD